MSKSPTFTPFPRLPLELRLKIWSFTIEPRILVIHKDPIHLSSRIYGPQPAILHVCVESREVGRSHYVPAFTTSPNIRSINIFGGLEKPEGVSEAIWFNSETDILYFGYHQSDREIEELMIYFDKVDENHHRDPREKVKTVALAEYLWRRDYGGSPFALKLGPWSIPNFSRIFKGLETLVIVRDQLEDRSGREAPREYHELRLIDAELGESMVDNEAFAIGACKEFYAGRQRRFPDEIWANVTAKELVVL